MYWIMALFGVFFVVFSAVVQGLIKGGAIKSSKQPVWNTVSLIALCIGLILLCTYITLVGGFGIV